MAPPLACTHEIYATRIASERVRTCGKTEKTREMKGREPLESLNSSNFAASARIIASDCFKLMDNKSFYTHNYDKKIGYFVMEHAETFCELAELSCFDFQQKTNGTAVRR